ncbi:MAG TPA: IclR family transcriptional regulator [Pseudolysinimonas sp.]|nr:IclR family transcriptional regulator [Pseudolysinimonas sp.]
MAEDESRSMLGRAALILRAFDEDNPVLDLGELGVRTGLPASSLHRIARAMAAEGLLDHTPGGYAIGTQMWEVGELAPVSLWLREAALPHLSTLYEQTGENVHLAVLAGTEALYVGRVTGTSSIPTLSRMGGRLPLHATGVGKALLAGQSEEWLVRYFRHPRERMTAHTIVDERHLRAEIEETRGRGWAVTRQEMSLGNVSIASALPATAGIPPAAVGVVVHTARATENRLSRLVMAAAQAIGRDLESH